MFSPTAIADFLACEHINTLNRAEAAGQIKRPYFADPTLELLIKLGNAHEQNYLKQLAADGRAVVTLATDGSRREAAARTIEAIRGGADVIYQPVFLGGDGSQGRQGELFDPVVLAEGEGLARGADAGWYGRADFLIR